MDGEGFILQVHGVFTHIRSGATLEALGGSALGSTVAAACAGSGFGSDLFEMATAVMGGKP
jgi:outer membrane lipoprotein SlyB